MHACLALLTHLLFWNTNMPQILIPLGRKYTQGDRGAFMNCQEQLLGAGQVFNERTLEEGSGRIFCTYTEGPWDEVVSFPFFLFLLLVFYRTYCRRSRGDVSLLLIWRPLIILHGLFSGVWVLLPVELFDTRTCSLFGRWVLGAAGSSELSTV
jgi:hypothetical protein